MNLEAIISLLEYLLTIENTEYYRNVIKENIKFLKDFKKYNSMKGTDKMYCLFMDQKNWLDFCKYKGLKLDLKKEIKDESKTT
jgi:hypothetical protein